MFSWNSTLRIPETKNNDWDARMLEGGKDFYVKAVENKLITPVDFMRRFVKGMYHLCPYLSCLTTEQTTIRYFAKQHALTIFYPQIKDLQFVSSDEKKAEVILRYCNMYGFTPDQALLVDDSVACMVPAQKVGIHALSPLTVYTMFQRMDTSECSPVIKKCFDY